MIKILVIDDEPGVCEEIKKAFSYVGFTVFTATNAGKALKIFEREKPKVILLDIIMPDVDGLDLLKKFKKKDPQVIVIMVTAKKDMETRARAIALGADDYVTKPFNYEGLRITAVKKIQKLLDQGGHMSKPVILIVDDEQGAREDLKNFISPRFSCDIEEASDGRSAMEQIKKIRADIVLLDIRMPGLSGMDVISEMKQISPHSKIIFISAWNSPDVVTKALSMGAADYIAKPIDWDLFQEKLESILLSLGKLKKNKREA